MPFKNIDPKLWGPSLWTFLHYLSLSYPENPTPDEQEYLFNFLASMQKIIPCEKCRINFLKHLDSMDVEVLTTRENLVKWIFNIHNHVNSNTNKSYFTYDEFINKYSENKTQKQNIIEHFDIIARQGEEIKNLKIELDQQIKAKVNYKEYFNFSSNTLIVGLILIVIIVIIIMNRFK